MTYTLTIAKDGEVIVRLGVSADEALAIVGRAIPMTADTPETQSVARYKACKKCGRSGKHASTCPRAAAVKNAKNLTAEIEGFHIARRQHPETARIEELLIEGKSTLEIMEKVKVSPPTIGVIRARLRKEGRLNE